MMRGKLLKALMVIFILFPLSEESCKVQVEKVNCSQKETSNLFYTCSSELSDKECPCLFENPLLSYIGWMKICGFKNELKFGKKKVVKRQIRYIDRCGSIQPPRPGKVSCSVTPQEITCIGKCADGYKFSDYEKELSYHCYYNEGIWLPSSNFPNCEPDCTPPCLNGGICVAPSRCSCPQEYRGERCQYSLRLCAVSKNYRASSWQCNYSRTETVCDISCNAPGTLAAKINSRRYLCGVDGVWFPPLPPCVEGSNLCGDPGDIQHGTRPLFSGEFKIGDSITYECDQEYEISRNAKITCQENGRWIPEKPECVQKQSKLIVKEEKENQFQFSYTDQCPKPRVPKNSIVYVTFPEHGALKKFFSSNLPFLDRIFFTMMSNDTEGQDLTESEGFFHVGTRIQYKCKSKFYKLYGSEYQTCQLSHTWSGYMPACVPECGKSDYPKVPFIVNGDTTLVGQWPWMVAIALKTSKGLALTCGGVLIDELWVLTAAHCVTKANSNKVISLNNLLVYFGKFFRSFDLDDEYVQFKKVERIIVHEEYDFIHYDADIALIKLENVIELTTRVQPICLPTDMTSRENIRDGKKGIVLGWGLTENGTYSDYLRETVLPVVNHDKCEEAYREGLRSVTITKNMFCAGHVNGEYDTCNGDSGGPFMFSMGPPNDERWYLEGLVSWGSQSGCAKSQRYSGFTKVGVFISWINKII